MSVVLMVAGAALLIWAATMVSVPVTVATIGALVLVAGVDLSRGDRR